MQRKQTAGNGTAFQCTSHARDGHSWHSGMRQSSARACLPPDRYCTGTAAAPPPPPPRRPLPPHSYPRPPSRRRGPRGRRPRRPAAFGPSTSLRRPHLTAAPRGSCSARARAVGHVRTRLLYRVESQFSEQLDRGYIDFLIQSSCKNHYKLVQIQIKLNVISSYIASKSIPKVPKIDVSGRSHFLSEYGTYGMTYRASAPFECSPHSFISKRPHPLSVH